MNKEQEKIIFSSSECKIKEDIKNKKNKNLFQKK